MGPIRIEVNLSEREYVKWFEDRINHPGLADSFASGRLTPTYQDFLKPKGSTEVDCLVNVVNVAQVR